MNHGRQRTIAGGLLVICWAVCSVGCGERAAGPAPVEPAQRPVEVQPAKPADGERVGVFPEAIAAPPPEAWEGPPDQAFNFGYTPPTEEDRAAFLETLPKPTLREAAPHFFQPRGPPAKPASNTKADHKPVLLYRALLKAHERKYGRPFVVGTQGIGDCVSWGWSHAADIAFAVAFMSGASGDFEMVATEATYGLARVEGAGKTRGGYSDGSYGAAAARGVTQFGVVLRRDYRGEASGECDLRTYSKDRAKAWGNYGCGGSADNGRLDAIAKQHAVRQVALVKTWEETTAAIENGYAIAVCSGQGFTSTRDFQGFCDPSGSWAHCMVAIATRFDVEAVLILNSWGPVWVRGPKWPPADLAAAKPLELNGPLGLKVVGHDGAELSRLFRPAAWRLQVAESDQPDGSFWCRRKTWEKMIAGRDSYAVSDVVGFPRRELRFLENF